MLTWKPCATVPCAGAQAIDMDATWQLIDQSRLCGQCGIIAYDCQSLERFVTPVVRHSALLGDLLLWVRWLGLFACLSTEREKKFYFFLSFDKIEKIFGVLIHRVSMKCFNVSLRFFIWPRFPKIAPPIFALEVVWLVNVNFPSKMVVALSDCL